MKVNKAQIREAERSKIAKQYSEKIINLEKDIQEHSSLRIEALNRAHDISIENKKLREENDELKEKIRVYEEWLDRMQEFCNLPEEERMNAVKNYQTKIKTNIAMKEIANIFSPYFNIIGNF